MAMRFDNLLHHIEVVKVIPEGTADIFGKPGEPAPEPPASRHGGFEVGDKVIYQNPYGIDRHPGEVVALHRNGNLHVREPKFGTTVDVHHTKVTPITSSQFERV